MVDRALRLDDFIKAFLRQGMSELTDSTEAWQTLQALVAA
jgi:flagellar biosynthesis/type III secretory pathway ATPase